MSAIKPPFPYYGGKQLLAARIIPLLPPHQHYVEPYAGSLSVLLAKRRVTFETVNDLDGRLIHFWRVLRDRPDDLARVCALTPHSRAEHAMVLDAVDDDPDDELERARRTFVLLTQGQSGGTSRRTGWRYFANPVGSTFSMPQYLEAYLGRFAAVVGRLAGVSLECRPAVDVIAAYGRHPGCLIFADPPYVLSARKSVGYRFEMTDDDHREMAAALRETCASVMLCGYASALYDEELFPDWHRIEMPAGTGNGGEWRDRTEVLWSNRPFPRQDALFDLRGEAS